jgi:calcineurin-like phosphoesterase family protein
MNIFFTSDTHFSHFNSIKFSNTRFSLGFNNVEEMNEYIISSWNKIIHPSDVVFHLGDVGFSNPKKIIEIVNRLNGIKFLVEGNHDQKLVKYLTNNPDIKCFDKIYRGYHEIRQGQDLIVLCHYPFHTWNKKHYGSFHLHGHCHGIKSEDYPNGRILDIGIDTKTDLSPYSLEEVLQNLRNIGDYNGR